MDGDTIEVLHDGQPEKIRLYGIDCPEVAHKQGEQTQPFGAKAKEFTALFCGNKNIRVVTKGKDRYDRTIGIIYLDDGKCLNEELLKAGLAWHYRKYDQTQAWIDLEAIARKNKTGLWNDQNPLPPWEYRHPKK